MKAAYLIGFRGAGKTTLGRAWAAETGGNFLDLDEEWEKRARAQIVEFISTEGEGAFRKSEEALLREMEEMIASKESLRPLLLATGGGVVDWEPSRQLLLASPLPKIYLEVPETDLWKRLEGSPERRKIGSLSSVQALNALMTARRPHYEKIATFRLVNRDITQGLTELKRLLSGW